jgi:hypothetical protein
MKWTGYIAYMVKKKYIQILVKKVHRNRPLGRLRKKQEDNIKTTNANCEGVLQIEVTKK